MFGTLFGFNGRLSRAGYIEALLAIALIDVALVIGHKYVESYGLPAGYGPTSQLSSTVLMVAPWVISVFTVWSLLAATIKRCHDRGRPGLLILLAVIPVIGWLWLLVDLFILAGNKGRNSYGRGEQVLTVVPVRRRPMTITATAGTTTTAMRPTATTIMVTRLMATTIMAMRLMGTTIMAMRLMATTTTAMRLMAMTTTVMRLMRTTITATTTTAMTTTAMTITAMTITAMTITVTAVTMTTAATRTGRTGTAMSTTPMATTLRPTPMPITAAAAARPITPRPTDAESAGG